MNVYKCSVDLFNYNYLLYQCNKVLVIKNL